MDELTGQSPSVSTTENTTVAEGSRRLDVVNRLTGSTSSASLQEEFASELATLRGRVDSLESAVISRTRYHVDPFLIGGTTRGIGNLGNGGSVSLAASEPFSTEASQLEGQQTIGSISRTVTARGNSAVLF